MPKLVLIQGNCDRDEFQLGDSFTIGRGLNNDLTLYDYNVSRQHALIIRQDNNHILKDLSSTNGTMVNGFYIHEKFLAEGDQLQIGKNVFLFEQDSTRIYISSKNERRIEFIEDNRQQRVEITMEMDTQTLKVVDEAFLKNQPQNLIKSYRKLAIIFEIVKTLTSSTEMVPLLSKILDTLFKVLPATLGCIFLADPYSQEFRPIIVKQRGDQPLNNETIAISKSLLEHIKQSKKGILTSQHLVNFQLQNDPAKTPLTASVLSVPIFIREQLIGIISVQDLGEQTTFTPDDLEIITAIAQQTSLALENIQLTQDRIKGERSNAIDQMVSSIAHEIKNPLSSIQIYTELLQKLHPSKEQFEYCDVILREIQHLLDITNQILDYGQYSSIHYEQCDLIHLIDDVVQLLEQQAHIKKISIKKHYELDHCIVPLDSDKMKQVLVNIIINALQVTPDKGLITIRLHVLDHKKIIRISISDTGSGISKEYIDKIFHPFFSNRKGGTGLGLAISQRLIEDHKGRITVESEPGSGTSFHIDLPMIISDLPLTIW
ncbi:FHA domain-containing protein [bacterium]|nr:FHA domain-containing protein [bacterium]